MDHFYFFFYFFVFYFRNLWLNGEYPEEVFKNQKCLLNCGLNTYSFICSG